ncbi:MAG TPA: oxidoreductase [Ramlibacter sp.]|nr:oxidoreductase [Ramlibacter sp.]
MSPTQRTWLITGCDKGMGYAVAEEALRQGHRVAVTVLDRAGKSPLEQAYPGRCRAYYLDVTQHEQAAQTIARIEADMDGLDVLVNNAGYGLVGAAEETSAQEYRRLFEVNFFGLVEVTRAVLAGMRARRRGHIVNFSSLVGFVGFAGMAMYSASKFAVEGYSESLAKELAPLGIHVTMIEPGSFRSDFAGASLVLAAQQIEDYAGTAGVVRTGLKAKHGAQPGDPAKLAKAIVQLTGMAKPPVRLALGADALQQVTAKIDAAVAEIEANRALSLSTSFDS